MLSRVKPFVSAMLIFVPQAVTVLKLFVELPSVRLPAVPTPDETKFAIPLIVRFPAPLCVIEFPEMSVRLLRLIAAVFTIAPVVLLPIVSVPAVIWPISADVRPRLAELSAPPRFTPAPSV